MEKSLDSFYLANKNMEQFSQSGGGGVFRASELERSVWHVFLMFCHRFLWNVM